MTKKQAKVAAEEPFVLTAMLSLVGAMVWLTIRHRLLGQFFYSTELLAITHLVTLGFASSFVQGVMQRLAPRSFGVAVRSRALSLWQCGLYLLGASGLIAHFAIEHWSGVAWSALLVLFSVVLLVWNFSGVFRAAWRGDWGARWISASLVHFVATAFLGAGYATSKVHGLGGSIWTAPLLDRLGAHAHVALLGWVGGAITGYQLKLLPATRASARMEGLRFTLVQGGLAGLIICLLLQSDAARFFALAIAAGIALRSVPAIVRIGGNQPGLWETIAHGLLLVLAAIGVELAWGWGPSDEESRNVLEFAYGYVALLGWVLLTVMGTSWKLFSTWVWEERFLPERGSKPIPPAHRLSSKLLRDASGTCILVGALGVATCMVREAGALPLRTFLGVHLLGVLLFVANFVRIARWELLKIEYRPPS
jgi:hypothetical protein